MFSPGLLLMIRIQRRAVDKAANAAEHADRVTVK
jgi:hypothetical protein